MAISIKSIGTLQNSLSGALQCSTYDAGITENVVLALLGAMIWRSAGEVIFSESIDSQAKTIWFWVNDKEYALSYNPDIAKIELNDGSYYGDTLAVFDNSSTYRHIISVFNGL